MEKEKAHRRPQPQTANDRSRTVVTTLLLLGGVFVLVMTWILRDYRLFVDRVTPYVPKSAEMLVTIPLGDGASSVLTGFDGDLGRALATIRFDKKATIALFVDTTVDNKKPMWRLMTDAPVDASALPAGFFIASFGHLRLISPTPPLEPLSIVRHKRQLSLLRRGRGEGFVMESILLPASQRKNPPKPTRIPLRLSLLEGGIKLEIGKRFRGLFTKPRELPTDVAQITFLPENVISYAILPPGRLPQIPAEYRLKTMLKSIIRISDMATEIVLTDEGSFATLFHGKRMPKIEAVEQIIIDNLRTLKPKEVSRYLPDGTKMIELRANRGKVSLKERSLPQNILLRTYSSEDGRKISLILYPNQRFWLTNDLMLVSSLLVSDISREMSDKTCRPSSSRPGAIFTSAYAKDIPNINSAISMVFSMFKVNFVRIEDDETELFTFCGYF